MVGGTIGINVLRLRRVDEKEIDVDSEILATYILSRIVQQSLRVRRMITFDKSNLLGFIGEILARRYIIPTICYDCDYVAAYTSEISPTYILDDPTLFKIVKGELITATDVPSLFSFLTTKSTESGREDDSHGTYSLNASLQEDLVMYSNVIFSNEVLCNLKDAMYEAFKTAQAYKLLTLPDIRNAAFDYVCLKMLEEPRKNKVMLKLRIRKRVNNKQGSARLQRVAYGVQKNVVIDLPEFKLQRLKLIEIKSSARTIKRYDVLSEARWDIKRKLRRLSAVNELETDVYVVLILLERERLRKARVITYKALVT